MLSTSDGLASKTVKLAKEIAATGIIPGGSRDSTPIPYALAPPFGPAACPWRGSATTDRVVGHQGPPPEVPGAGGGLPGGA
jgi:hypothetical protein